MKIESYNSRKGNEEMNKCNPSWKKLSQKANFNVVCLWKQIWQVKTVVVD